MILEPLKIKSAIISLVFPSICHEVTVVLEKTLESPLDCKDTQPVYPKRNQFSIFIGRSDVEDEIPILWLPDVKN